MPGFYRCGRTTALTLGCLILGPTVSHVKWGVPGTTSGERIERLQHLAENTFTSYLVQSELRQGMQKLMRSQQEQVRFQQEQVDELQSLRASHDELKRKFNHLSSEYARLDAEVALMRTEHDSHGSALKRRRA